MRGELDADQQLKVLGKIWGADRDGYVFLPWIDGSANTVARRRRGYHEGRAFEWPRERGAILDHLRGHDGDDLYFTPALFNAKRRTEQNVDAERTLWADLDPVDPRSLGDLRPTVAWETSPGRWQGVWLLDRPRVGASWPSKENHRLSLHIGADPSGWDSTQLLRVPGRANHKFIYGEGAVPGKLVWDNGPRYVWEDFEDLPEVGIVAGEDVDLLDDELLAGVDRHALWARVRLKVSHNVREYMALKERPDGADRSAVLWEIERELADAGCTLLEIVALVRPSVWNKYAGRNDELKRLKHEAAKAIAARDDTVLEQQADEEPKPKIRWLSEVAAQVIPKPRWLVENVWTRGGCGFISGAPKSYKSWLALDMAVSVSTGMPWLGIDDYRVRRAAPVLYLQEEDDLRLVMDRLSTVLEARAPERHWRGCMALYGGEGADPMVTKGSRARGAHRVTWAPPEGDVPLAPHVQTGFVASDPSWQAWLAETVAEGKFGLVVIDTLGTTAGDVDMDKAGDLMGRILRPLRVIAGQNDCAIQVVHHNKKNGEGRAGQQMLGSVALHAWVDCALYARAEGDGVVHVTREAKLAPEEQVRLRVARMYEDVRTGDRQLWDVGVVPHTPTEPGQDAGEKPQAAGTDRPRRERGMRADTMRVRLRAAGKGPWARDHLEALDIDPDRGVRIGVLRLMDDGRYARVEG